MENLEKMERIKINWQHGVMEQEYNTIRKSYVQFESKTQQTNFLKTKEMYKNQQQNIICLPIKQITMSKTGFICHYQLPKVYQQVMIFKRFYKNKKINYSIHRFLSAVYEFSQGVKKLHQQDIIVGYLDWSNLLVFILFQEGRTKYKLKTTQFFKDDKGKRLNTQKLVPTFSGKIHTQKPKQNHFVPEGAEHYSKQTDVFAISAIIFLALRKNIPTPNSPSIIQTDGFKRDEMKNQTIKAQLKKIFGFVLRKTKQIMDIKTLCDIVFNLIKESEIYTEQALASKINQAESQFYSL